MYFPPFEKPDKAPDIWDGTVDTSWYNDAVQHFSLDTAEEIAGLSMLASQGETFEGKTITLTNSIDLSGLKFTPIGATGTPFMGTFDGGENTISGYSNDSTAVINDGGDRYFTALFAAVDGGTVKNVTFEAYDVNLYDDVVPKDRMNQRMVSVAVGNLMNGGTVENVIVEEGIVNSPVRVAGIVARASGGTNTNPNRIIRSENYADVNSEYIGESYSASPTYGTAGGIISTTASADYTVIQDSINNGTIIGMVSGGIAGDIQGQAEFSDNTNNGNIKGALSSGGIAGNLWYGAGVIKIDNCHNSNSAIIESTESYRGANGGQYSDANIGGIVGLNTKPNVFITNSTNNGILRNDIEGILVSIGGIVGSDIEVLTIENCTSDCLIENVATIVDSDNVRNKWTTAGVVGYIFGDYKKNISVTVIDSYGKAENFSNDNEFHVFGDVIGGVRSLLSHEFSISFSENVELDNVVSLISAGSFVGPEDINTATYNFKGVNAEGMNFSNGRQTIKINLNDSTIHYLQQLMNTDIGSNWDDTGIANISGGNIDELIIFPDDFSPSSGIGYDNKITLENIGKEINWEIPNFNIIGNGSHSFYINNEVIKSSSGTISTGGDVTQNP